MEIKAKALVTTRIDGLPFWLPQLRRGVTVETAVGVPVLDFLIRVLDLSPDYIAFRIGSVFLDGHPVDDIASALLVNGCTLALGMAAPGLAGSSLNRGSPLAGFRGDISYHPGQGRATPTPGEITLKLFNLVATEAGPHLLRLGFDLPGHVLAEAATVDPAGYEAAVAAVDLGGQSMEVRQAATGLANIPRVRVTM